MSQDLQLDKDLHLQFIKDLDGRVRNLDYWQADYLRMNGVYWALTSLLLLRPDLSPMSDEFDRLSPLSRREIITFVSSCQDANGGFGGNAGHDPHLTFTLSAIQILHLLDAKSEISWDQHLAWISGRQGEDGSFTGDHHGEVDTRFSYCAISALRLLDRLDAVNVPKAIVFVQRCRNYDGGFGVVPGCESHAGQVFCCVGMLTMLNVDSGKEETDRLAEWLAWRQLPSGGLNGRPEKLPDVCYSWWVLSSLAMLDRLHWISRATLRNFILQSQDPVSGGFSDRPGDMADIFHTLFGIAGLSLLGESHLASIDPRFCMPSALTNHL